MLRLIEANEINEQAYDDYIREWECSGERMVPAAASRRSEDFLEQIRIWNSQKTIDSYENGFVPATLYFLADEMGRLLGAIHFRHELNDFLRQYGGHIGYGIRPSERRRGHASRMLSMMLERLQDSGIEQVLITCDDANQGSSRTIEGNGGVLEDIVPELDRLTRRYWVPVKSPASVCKSAADRVSATDRVSAADRVSSAGGQVPET